MPDPVLPPAEPLPPVVDAARLSALLDAAPVGLLLVKHDGTIGLANAQLLRMFGFARDELVGQPLEVLLPSRYRADYSRERLAFAGAPRSLALGTGFELFGLRLDGTEFPVDLGFAPLASSDGLGVVVSAVDISERKRIFAELERSHAELEQFAQLASHDLQEPLRQVVSFTQLFADLYQGQLDEKADKYVNHIVDGAKRMQRLVADLLSYSLVGAQGGPLEDVDADATFRAVLRTLDTAIRESAATVEVDHLPHVRADAAQLAQVFQNLLDNALKFKRGLPLIRVNAEAQGDRWLFSIQDNGLGIEMRQSERIFRMFQRLHGRAYEGNGAGLTIARRIVQRHGGKIWFTSELGHGTTFFFTLARV